MEKTTMSVQELSAQMGISLPKAYELVKTPGFPTIRIGARILIPIEAYKEWRVPLLAKYVREHLQYILVRDNGKQGLLKYVYEGGCYRLYADNMLLGIIKKYIADYDEELVKMSKVNEVLLHITTDLTYVSQDALNADEDIINFQNGILKITATDTELIPHSADILSTIQLPCEWSDEYIDTPVFDSYMDTLTNGDEMVSSF